MAAENKKNGGNGSHSSSSSSSSYSSIADEIFGWKDDSRSLGLKSSSSSSSPSYGGYFSSVFPPASGVMGNNSSHSDLYQTLNKCGHAGNSAGSKAQGSSIKGETAQKDERSIFVNEPSESSYFGSSVHYGGRDFYTSSYTTQASATRKTYKPDDADEVDDKNAANRGEWWQGSFYY